MRTDFFRNATGIFLRLWIHLSAAMQSKQLVVLFLLLLTGCATLVPPTAPTVVKTIILEPSSEPDTLATPDFKVMGRVSVRNTQHHFSGNVHWQHTEPEDHILLLSPLGQTIAEIWSNHDKASLLTAKHEEYHARNVEDLTAEILGWRLPLNGLQHWIQGTHSPASIAKIELDSDDRIVAIHQDGWQILYVRYFAAQSGQDITRPRILELQYDDLKIRMVVDNWI